MLPQDLVIDAQPLARAIEDDASLDQDDAAVGNRRQGRVVLVDDEWRRCRSRGWCGTTPPDLAGDQRRQPSVASSRMRRSGLVMSARPMSASAARRPRAARRRGAGRSAGAEGREHALERPCRAAVDAGPRRHHQVFADREVREDAAALGHEGDAAAGEWRAAGPRSCRRRLIRTVPWRGPRQAEDAAQQGRLAHAVAAHERHRLAAPDRQGDAVQDVARAVEGVGCRSPRPAPDQPCWPPSGSGVPR